MRRQSTASTDQRTPVTNGDLSITDRLPTAGEPQRLTREACASCGRVTVGLDDVRSRENVWELACIEDALAKGQAAKLAVTLIGDEGDPMGFYYRLTSEGQGEICQDTTDDTFGPKHRTLHRCPVVYIAHDTQAPFGSDVVLR